LKTSSMKGVLDIPRKLFEGVSVEDMVHVPEISSYNHNYYMVENRLLFGKSDDDNFTQWYWIKGSSVQPIGGSYCSEGDIIIVDRAYI